MLVLTNPKTGGAILMALGVMMISSVFVFSIIEYTRVRISLPEAENIMDALMKSSGLLIELLFKVAFLGIALAAGATLIRYAISLIREEAKG